MYYEDKHVDATGVTSANFYFTIEEGAAARKGVGEAAMGIKVDNRIKELGMSRIDAKAFYQRLRDFNQSFKQGDNMKSLYLSIPELRVIRNGLRLTLDELGEDEYYFRSGQKYTVGQDALAEFDRVLAEIEAR